jgi:hypothetical protein
MEPLEAFIAVSQQQGISPHVAKAAYHSIEATLENRGYKPGAVFYGYRTGMRGDRERGAEDAPQLPVRVLVVFSSPDAAIAFVQRNRMLAIPRLVALHLAQLLTLLLKHPAIGSLVVAEEYAEVSWDMGELNIPARFRLDRIELLDMLKGPEF